MSTNKNPQQSDPKAHDATQSERSSASGRQGEQSNTSRGQQFEGVRGASRGNDMDKSESGSRDVESILDQIEESFRSLRQAIGSGRSGEKSSQSAEQYGASAGGQTASSKTGSSGSDKGQQSGGQGAGRSGGQTGR